MMRMIREFIADLKMPLTKLEVACELGLLAFVLTICIIAILVQDSAVAGAKKPVFIERIHTEVREVPVYIAKHDGVKPDNKLADKNINFLNIKALPDGQKWKGQVGVDRRGFVKFSSPEYGIRAAAHILTAYYVRHDKDTLAKIIKRFSTSDQKDYTVFLSHQMKLGANEPFHVLERLPELMRCMARYECGRWLPKRMFVGYDIASASYRLGKEERK